MTSVTVVVPMTIRRRGGRKQIIGPDGAPVQARDNGAAGVAETRGDPALVKALARAFRWRRMLEEGRYASIRELAAAEGVDRSYVARLLRLTLLAPDVVEAILDGREPSTLITPALVVPQTSEPRLATGALGTACRQISLGNCLAGGRLQSVHFAFRPSMPLTNREGACTHGSMASKALTA